MAVRIVRLGQPREPWEGIRIGAVRHPPRGVRKEHYASENWFDVWYPELAPTAELMARGKAVSTDADWNSFPRAFRSELDSPATSRTLDLLATLSREANFSLGCYCENEARCHRSVLREALHDRGAKFA
jgi:uncharacterized protein YeaO (DUF488 family)